MPLDRWVSLIDQLPFCLLPDPMRRVLGVEDVEGFASGQPFPEAN